MNARVVCIPVTVMLTAPILLVVSHVPVELDTAEMGWSARVSMKILSLCYEVIASL